MITRRLIDGAWQPIAASRQKITSLSSATALTVPTGARLAVVMVETQAVRWSDDGTDPTASSGMPIAAGGGWIFDSNLSALKFIEQVSGAVMNVSYYG